ncbi:TRAP transporter permease [Pararhizobium haloflavum]|uniref:TRAP transporter permease n=1 Tax=Pararhizobium haloflavum TaxID=2037914 RepID=UPI000C19B1B2|nr:TRAP transporter fused permease subunit [Pararhizobium haloflavum]
MSDPEVETAPQKDAIGRLLVPLAILWALYHLFGAGLGYAGAHDLRAVHIAGAITLIVAWRPLPAPFRIIDLALIAVTVTAISYLIANADEIVGANWFTNEPLQRALGLALFICLMEAIRRALGWVFVGLISIFLAYAVLGPYIPGMLGHRGLGFDRLIYSFYLGNQGVFGSLIGISAGVVALFLIFGEILNAGGAGRTFINIAIRIGGRLKGGAGMVAVIGSAFMGMVNGSAVANVTSTGVLTIPLMRRLGFSRNLAGAIEAVASTGGQFMPPIMGPGAFLLAELLGISYLEVATAALIPSALFYLGLLFAVWLFAGKRGLQPVPEDMIPSRAETYAPAAMVALFVPIGLLIGFILARYTVQYAVFWAIVAAIGLFALQTLAVRLVGQKTAKGETHAAPIRFGPAIYDAFARAADTIAYIAMIVTAAQLIVAIINLSGLGVTLSQIIVSLGQDSAILSLILTMIVAILLGMGMPTPAAYAIAAAVLGPPLGQLGYQQLPSHLFIYYFACLAAITPPVASAVFAATAISRGKVFPTAGYAVMLSLSLFIIPFLFIDNPVLLMDGDISEVMLVSVTAAIGVATLSLATIGHFQHAIQPALRLALGAAALAMIVPGILSDVIGLVLMAGSLFLHLKRPQQRMVMRSKDI